MNDDRTQSSQSTGPDRSVRSAGPDRSARSAGPERTTSAPSARAGDPADEPPLSLRARTPEDLLAMVPVVLGFEPAESLTMLTFSTGHRFHARVDLPPLTEHADELADLLLGPVHRHAVDRVVLVLHSRRRELAERCAARVFERCEAEGVTVVELLLADGGRWSCLHPYAERPDRDVAYDLTGHPFVLEAMLRGMPVLSSREELAASVGPDPAAVEEVAGLLAGAPTVPAHPPAERAWLRALLGRYLRDRTPPGPDDVARVLVALGDAGVRDEGWLAVRRSDAAAHVELWTRVVRAAPADRVAAPASLLAFAAWLSGHGALAWCALDRVPPGPEDQLVATYVRAALEHAVPPDAWSGDERHGSPA